MATAFSLLFVFLCLLSLSSISCHSTRKRPDGSQDLVRSSCVHASYPNICIRTLSSYAGPAKTPRDLALASVRVSLCRAKKVSAYLSGLRSGSRGEKAALSDCVEQMGDSVDELSQTLSELQQLGGEGFRWHMSNAETWVSAALTNEDTCLEGFKEVGDRARSDVKRKIKNVSRVTSNALYLISRLDQAQGKSAPHH